jgi:hypothetical protein
MWLYIFFAAPLSGMIFSVAFFAAAVAAYFVFDAPAIRRL